MEGSSSQLAALDLDSDSKVSRPDYAGAIQRHPVSLDLLRTERDEATAARDRNVDKFKRQAGVRLSSCRFSNYEIACEKQRQVVGALREWSGSIRERMANAEGLVIYGPVGTGKDHLAFAAVGEAVFNTGASCRWVNGREFFGAVRDRISEEASERELILSLAAFAILVISDPLPPIGDLTQHQADMLYRVCEARYAAKRLTVATLNVASDEEADRRLGAPTWDRLCHGAWKVACSWASHRKPAREIG